jgi:hypothetical protein
MSSPALRAKVRMVRSCCGIGLKTATPSASVWSRLKS